MGKRGPKPKPTVMKELHQTIRTKDRRRGPDALAPGGGLVAPDYFTAELRARWAEILRLAPMGVLKPIDASTLEDFVVNEDTARRAYASIGDDLTIEGDKATVRNPLLLIYHKAVEAKRAAADRLGFSPSARVGLPVDEHTNQDDSDDVWAELAKGMWQPEKFHSGTRIPINEPRASRRAAKKLKEAEKVEELIKLEPKGKA
jgi:P27 family predicted phage terminase small subunit